MIASGWFRSRKFVPLISSFCIFTFTIIFFFLFFCFFVFLFWFWFLAPAGEQASSQSIECHKQSHSYDDFKAVCCSDDNIHGWCKQCTRTETQRETLTCFKCSPNDLFCYHYTRERRVCFEFCHSITKHPVQTLFSLRTCLPNGKSQTGRYH